MTELVTHGKGQNAFKSVWIGPNVSAWGSQVSMGNVPLPGGGGLSGGKERPKC